MEPHSPVRASISCLLLPLESSPYSLWVCSLGPGPITFPFTTTSLLLLRYCIWCLWVFRILSLLKSVAYLMAAHDLMVASSYLTMVPMVPMVASSYLMELTSFPQARACVHAHTHVYALCFTPPEKTIFIYISYIFDSKTSCYIPQNLCTCMGKVTGGSDRVSWNTWWQLPMIPSSAHLFCIWIWIVGGNKDKLFFLFS